MRNVNFSAAAGANVGFQGVAAAPFASAQKPNHYVSLPKKLCLPVLGAFAATVRFAEAQAHGCWMALISVVAIPCAFLFYSRTACTSPLRLAFPPVDSAKTALQTLQVTVLTALLKTSCSLPHLGHLTRRKVLRGLGISLFHSLMCFFSYAIVSFLRRMPSLWRM
jgi:hypothetical protein